MKIIVNIPICKLNHMLRYYKNKKSNNNYIVLSYIIK